jgi:hypothetical protein
VKLTWLTWPTLFLIFLTIFFIRPAYATVSPPLPNELFFQGQPLDPFCFYDPTGDKIDHPIDPTMCRSNNSEDSSASISYKYLGKTEKGYILSGDESGGGTAFVTFIYAIQREGNLIRVVDRYPGGDRCMGGLKDMEVENGKLVYSKFLTPADIIRLVGISDVKPDSGVSHIKHHHGNLDGGLAASAASCFGIAHYEDKNLISIALEDESKDISLQDRQGWTENFRFQSCYNKLQRSYIGQGKKILDSKLMKAFADDFRSKCLGQQ